MIQHLVLLKWKAGTTDEEVLTAFEGARNIPDQVPGVERLTIGRNRANADHGFTHALSVQLVDEGALTRYLEHPARAKFIDDCLAPIEEQRIEIDVPVDRSLSGDPGQRDWDWGAGAGMGPPLEDED